MRAAAHEREADRNRRLRRADWRFLLPAPWPSLTASFVDGPLAQAAERISDRLVPAATAPRGACDLVVASDPTPAMLRHGFGLLRPGGACYVEHTVTPVRTSCVGQQLRAAGFVDVRTYWPCPSPDRCLAWISLDTPGALAAFFRRDARGGAGVRLRAAAEVRLAIAGVRRLLGRTAPIASVGVKRHPGLAGSRQSAIDLARQHGGTTAGYLPGSAPFVLHVPGSHSRNKVLGVLYDRRSCAPTVVVKVARTHEGEAGLINEAAILEALQAIPGMPGGAPHLLFRLSRPGAVAIGETALTGAPVRIASPAEYRRTARTATDWLVRLASASRTAPCSSVRITVPAVAEFARCYEGAAPGLAARLASRLARIPPLPAVLEHRDFAPWNVFAGDDGGIVVFDWESSVRDGVPGPDLLYFLSYLALAQAQARRLSPDPEAHAAAWDAATAVGQVNRECFSRYARALDLDPRLLPDLRLLTWALHAPSEYARAAAQAGAAPSPAVLRRGTFLRLIERELAAGPARG